MEQRRFLPDHIDPKDVKGIEPKHITYVKDQNGKDHDALWVKELIHLKDGSQVPFLGHYIDYQRPFWITQKGRQTHNDKRDYELQKNLQKFKCRQIDLPARVAKTLGDFSHGPNPPIKKLARSPYLYGVDVSSACLLKNDFRTKFPGLITPNRIAAGDIETNIFSDQEEIICMSVTCKENALLVYLKDWIGDVHNPIEKTHAAAQEHIGETLRERNITLSVEVVDTSAEIVERCMNRLHEWKPDFFTFWNMDFDITHMTAELERAGKSPAVVFSDPSVPPQFQYFNYRQGQSQKVTASGKTFSINIEDRWNWVTHPASFQIIDSMTIYRLLRLHEGKEPSYALDSILDKTLNITKLKFEETQHLKARRWHEVMQQRYKIEYGVYNIFDSISLELLDEKTNDLALRISTSSKNSDYKNFNSGPKRLCDDMHFWYLNQPEPKVIGSSSDDPVEEIDSEVIGHGEWMKGNISSP